MQINCEAISEPHETRKRAENIQHASLPRNESSSGSELKQSVTKRNYT